MVPSSAEAGAEVCKASQWVVFACGDHWFGLPLEHSREILTPRAMTRLPGCGPEVCGLAGIRGRVHTVFDFGTILVGRSSLGSPDYRMLVLVVNGRRIAVVVDDVVAISPEPIEVQPYEDDDAAHLGVEPADIVGTGAIEGRPFLVIDPNRILGRLLT